MVLIADRHNSRLDGGQLALADLAELGHAVSSFGPASSRPPTEPSASSASNAG